MASLRSPARGVPPPVSRLDVLEHSDDDAGLGSELLPGLQGPVVGDDFSLGSRTDRLLHPFLQPFEHPISVLGLDVQVVDVDDVLRFELFGEIGRRLLLGIQRNRLAVQESDFLTVHRVEIRDRLNNTVLTHLEVVAREAGDSIALGVGHHDLDVGDIDRNRLRHRGADLLVRGRARLGWRSGLRKGADRDAEARRGENLLQAISSGPEQKGRRTDYSPVDPPGTARRAPGRRQTDNKEELQKNRVALSFGIQQNSGPPGRKPHLPDGRRK